MEFTHCFGCMEHSTSYPCKHCGYDPSRESLQPYYLRPGTILYGRYVVGKMLGQGGFGITYIGWDLSLDRCVAMKEYFPAGQVMREAGSSHQLQWFTTPQAKWAQSEGLEKFMKEARKMSRVSHIPEVVHVHDLFQENGTAYIVMDFVQGCTLKAQMEATGVLSWDKAKKTFLPLIQAMEKVHQFGIIHRDISPDNIMLQPDGQARILDLGAAKDISINSGASSMQVAKAGFSPLEQYQVGGSGTWTDVYAMAATIYYALTGVVPPAAMDRLDTDTIRWDLPGIRALPQSVQRALVRALAVSAQKRTRTMGEFLAQLQEPASAPTPPKPKIEPKVAPSAVPTDKRKLLGGIAAVLILLIMICGLISAFDETSTLEPEPKGTVHVHAWKSATCTAPRTCTTCGATEGTSLGHNWKDSDCTHPKTCTRCNQTSGSAAGHKWKSATCESPKVCTVCGEENGSALGHKWIEGTCDTPKTCSVCGKTEGSALGHDWKAATYDAPKTCSRCGMNEGDPLGYLEKVNGEFSRFEWGSFYTNKYTFTEPVKGCKDFQLYYKPVFNSNCYVSKWKLLLQDTSGTWHDNYGFTLNETDYYHNIVLTSKMDIQAIAVIPTITGTYSYNFYIGVYDVHFRN